MRNFIPLAAVARTSRLLKIFITRGSRSGSASHAEADYIVGACLVTDGNTTLSPSLVIRESP